MDGRVLGEVIVKPPASSGRPTVKGTTKPAALFALLVTSPDSRCSFDDVYDCLWPEGKHSRDNLDQVMTVLRKAVGGRKILTGRSNVCSIRAARNDIDLYRFRDLLISAQGQFGKDRFNTVSAAMREWPEGTDPLAGLTGAWAEMRRVELRAEWLRALRAQFEAARRAIAEDWLRIESDRRYHELPEEPWLLRFYLEHCGDELSAAKVKSAISKWKRRFKKPDEDLQDVIDRLQGRPTRPRAVRSPVPNQLPARGRTALGREGVIDEVVGRVRAQEPGRPSVALISGMPGIGTSLVGNQVAHRLREEYPDGALYADLGGPEAKGEQRADPEYIIDRFLAEFPLHTSPVGLVEKSAALRSVLADRSVLILLDNVWDDSQVLPLLPGTGPSTVLITSHRRLEVLQARNEVVTRTLTTLDEANSTALLQEYIPTGDHGKASQEVKDLVEFCGGHPLALTIAVRRVKGHPVGAIRDLRRQLKEEEERLDALEHLPSQLSVRAAFACSVNDLSETARCLLWQLAVHPGPSISRAALLDLGRVAEGVHPDRAAEELMDLNLLEVSSGRYRLHSLMRTFARQRVRPQAVVQGSGFEKATVRQILEHQLQSSWACDQWLDGQRWLPVGEPEPVLVDRPVDLREALESLEEEYETLIRCIELSVERSCPRYTWLLPMVLVTYQWRRHRFEDAQRFLGLAAEAAASCDAAPVDQAMICRMQAGTRWRQGQFHIAANHLERAVRLSEQDSSDNGLLSLARSLHTLALTRRKQGLEAEAERNHGSALQLYRRLGNDAGTAAALNGLGTIHHDRGELPQAIELCTEAMELVSRTVDRSGTADVLRTLAVIRATLGEREAALPLFERAIGIYRELGSWTDEDRALCLQTDSLVAMGRTAEAMAAMERVLALRELMGGNELAEARERLESLR
ncbi:tetratricopeptide repeat protein [Kitasatospora sp. NPDC056651]|uniref:AfsR/SARP family transcriptional regulator n=1 Tax=Kitasatospora sp. NPDC056651 TaxID=3345892 RepID=UPI0036CD555C